MHDATVVELQRSARYLRQMEHAIDDRAARVKALGDALRGLVTLTGETDLSVGTASERGPLDWRTIGA